MSDLPSVTYKEVEYTPSGMVTKERYISVSGDSTKEAYSFFFAVCENLGIETKILTAKTKSKKKKKK